MKKFILSAALVLAAFVATKAEVVSRDTIAYSGEYRLEKVEKSNDYGEISVKYVCYLNAITNSKGEPRKVTVTKATYESGRIDAIVYVNGADGSRKIRSAAFTNGKAK